MTEPPAQNGPSITVHVRLADFLVRLAPEADMDVTVPVGTAAVGVVRELARQLDPHFQRAVLDREGRVNSGVVIAVNREAIPRKHFEDLPLTDNATMKIMVMVGGG